MLTFLLVIQAIVAVLLVGVILMQQSEGGGLGMGGSPTGLMSARGAADFLTRATTVLAALFIGLSILHAVLATRTGAAGTIDTSLARKLPPTAPTPTVPLANAPAQNSPGAGLTGAGLAGGQPAPMGGVASTTSVPMAAAPADARVDVAPVATPRPARTDRAGPRAVPKPDTPVVAPPPVAATAPTSGNAN